MSGYCFYTPEAQALAEQSGTKTIIDNFAEAHKRQTYILHVPLAKKDADYDYDQAFAIFSSGLRPCFVNFGDDEEAFEEFYEDFIDDIAFLSEKFDYREKIGRKKHWVGLFDTCSAEDLDKPLNVVDSTSEKRVVDLLTSLVVGSINDVSKINLQAEALLDTVKSKIILFDTDQTSFVFKNGANKRFVIQGLAGSGKTELLLHKIKEIYSKDFEARVAFTCFNKILASSMKKRIPNFFNFMRVERQIDWGKKLFCFHSWGSGKDPYSGLYRYICHSYGIPFKSLQAGPFEYVCREAIKAIESLSGERKYIFDYVFIDESQDFDKSFIELCDLVTSKRVYVAGDVFQNIFRPISEEVSRADMVLKKCYRTDPKNLMFSHALGMGLFENPVLRWLKPSEWEACGYVYKEESNRAVVSRDPLRRFEDIPDDFKSTLIHERAEGSRLVDEILNVVKGILARHPTALSSDFAVIFLDKSEYVYNTIPELKVAIEDNFDWEVNISFETKESDSERFFISNINNAKGLEFPFVICYARNLNTNYSFRNALYTMMARSYLESHLVVGATVDQEVLSSVRSGLNHLTKYSDMNLRIPSKEEVVDREYIVLDELSSVEDVVRGYCAKRDASPRLVAKLISRINLMTDDGEYDEDYLNRIIKAEYERFKKL
ncbi:DEAD/DEAH box helicase [Pseudomonas inefficax]|uniref:DEAD/DEAH box helicase n=1 Tax=Pseudomonas inefficax TaxID=2078786 RepID=UPI0035C65DEC